MSEHSAEKDYVRPLEYLRRLQEEADGDFHKTLRAWVDDKSSVARVLMALDELNPPPEQEEQS